MRSRILWAVVGAVLSCWILAAPVSAEDGRLTPEFAKRLRGTVKMDASTRALQNALTSGDPKPLVLNRRIVQEHDAVFSHKIKSMAITNQATSGRCWMFAALNTMEPPVLDLVTAKIFEGDKPWAKERLPLVEARMRERLKQLSTHLGGAEWLDGAFSAGDLMMASVLLRLKSSGLLDEYPNLAAYLARGEARPAYKRAFAAQLAVNTRPATG